MSSAVAQASREENGGDDEPNADDIRRKDTEAKTKNPHCLVLRLAVPVLLTLNEDVFALAGALGNATC